MKSKGDVMKLRNKMNSKDTYKLSDEEIAAGVVLGDGKDVEVVYKDVSDKQLEKMARGFIMGTEQIGRRREIRQELEEKVTKKIGNKGKYLVDKLFELIEGVYLEEKGLKKNGTIRYYKVPPNLQAIIYALDRVLGKPKMHIDKTEEKRGVILVEHVIKNIAGNPYRNANGENGVGANIGRKQLGAGGGEESGAGVGSVERKPEGIGAGAV